ncbi:MAG: hypothetical protein R6U36_07730 [Candidatus Fermentibacteraceae bacterium]
MRYFFPVLFAGLAACAWAGSVRILDHDLEIPVGGYRYVAIPVQPSQEEDARIVGDLKVDPDTLGVELLLIWEYQMPGWTELEAEVDTLYHSRQASGSVNIPLLGFGRYALILSNRGNYAPAEVHGTLSLVFEGEGRVYDPLQTALYLALALVALGGIVTLVVVAVRTFKNK